MRKIKQLTTELTFRCNARCPACHRQRINKINLNDPKYTYTLESFKEPKRKTCHSFRRYSEATLE